MLGGCREGMVLMLVFVLGIVPVQRACLQCDRRIRTLHEDFILSAPSLQDQIDLAKICDQAYLTYRQSSQQRKGVIDPTTLYRARTEYQSEFDHFWKSQPTGSLTINAIQIMDKGREILEKHLNTFVLDGLCPNKCGFLKRRVMDCLSCRYKSYTCSSGQLNCGEHPVQAEEGDQAVLNCFLPWHRLLLGRPEYHYSWAPGIPGARQLNENDFKVLVVTEDSSVVLNQLQVNEQGTYRCSLQDQNGTVFYRATFLLTVAPLPDQTQRPIPTLSLLPLEDDDSPLQRAKDMLVPVLSVVTVLSLAASVGVTLFLGRMINQRTAAEEEARSLRTEGRNIPNIV